MCIVGKQFVYLDPKPCWHDNSTDKALLDDSILLCFFSPDMSIFVSKILHLHLQICYRTYPAILCIGADKLYLHFQSLNNLLLK